jgi:hypothetical protein
MRYGKRFVGTICALAALGYGTLSCSKCVRPAGPVVGGSGDPRSPACIARHGFPVTDGGGPGGRPRADGARPAPQPEALCEGDLCGANGGWLGQGVAFRTLHLDGSANPQDLRITAFRTGHNVPAELDVDRDVVIGKTMAETLRADQAAGIAKLKGSTLTLERKIPGQSDDPRQYTLTIHDIQQHAFLAQPPCPEGQTCELNQVTVYTFTAVASDGCEVEVCKPGLDPDHQDGLSGRAVIFRGDLYGEPGQLVKRVEPAGTGDGAKINFACLGTSLSKLHLLRHTVASRTDNIDPPSVDQEEALLRLLRADYCGTGTSFTQDELQIRIGVRSPAPQPTQESRFRLDDAVSLDALWNKDGAMCIGTPRWAPLAEIQTECAGAGGAIPLCADLPGVTLGTPFAIDNHAVSANPVH